MRTRELTRRDLSTACSHLGGRPLTLNHRLFGRSYTRAPLPNILRRATPPKADCSTPSESSRAASPSTSQSGSRASLATRAAGRSHSSERTVVRISALWAPATMNTVCRALERRPVVAGVGGGPPAVGPPRHDEQGVPRPGEETGGGGEPPASPRNVGRHEIAID